MVLQHARQAIMWALTWGLLKSRLRSLRRSWSHNLELLMRENGAPISMSAQSSTSCTLMGYIVCKHHTGYNMYTSLSHRTNKHFQFKQPQIWIQDYLILGISYFIHSYFQHHHHYVPCQMAQAPMALHRPLALDFSPNSIDDTPPCHKLDHHFCWSPCLSYC